jgi:hypothetical protein
VRTPTSARRGGFGLAADQVLAQARVRNHATNTMANTIGNQHAGGGVGCGGGSIRQIKKEQEDQFKPDILSTGMSLSLSQSFPGSNSGWSPSQFHVGSLSLSVEDMDDALGGEQDFGMAMAMNSCSSSSSSSDMFTHEDEGQIDYDKIFNMDIQY